MCGYTRVKTRKSADLDSFRECYNSFLKLPFELNKFFGVEQGSSFESSLIVVVCLVEKL